MKKTHADLLLIKRKKSFDNNNANNCANYYGSIIPNELIEVYPIDDYYSLY